MTLVAAIPNANAHGQAGLTPGLPDLLVLGPDIPGGWPIAFLELKRVRRDNPANRKLTPTEEAQKAFAILCAQLGILCTTVYGRDEPIQYLEKWNIVRQQRYPEIRPTQAWP
jgi:hypothetical protein